MSKRPCPLYDTRHHSANGIQWNGFLYEPIPQLGNKSRLMIIADNGDHLIVSAYSSNGWHERCTPTGEQYVSKKLGLGRPTKGRVKMLQSAVRELQKKEA